MQANGAPSESPLGFVEPEKTSIGIWNRPELGPWSWAVTMVDIKSQRFSMTLSSLFVGTTDLRCWNFSEVLRRNSTAWAVGAKTVV